MLRGSRCPNEKCAAVRRPLARVRGPRVRQRIVLGRQASVEKSNEIIAIPLLLKNLDVQGALIAMGTIGT
jgi:hypothetical protein